MCRGATITLTAASAILMATGASANVTPAGNLSAQADTINANINLNSAFIQDTTAGDADVLNATLAATYTANQATILGIETINLTGAGGSLNVANTTGVTAFNLVNGNVAMTNVGTATPVTINAGFAGNANLQSANAAAGTADFAITLAGGSATANVGLEDSGGAALGAGDVVTATVSANTTLNRLADNDLAAAAAAGTGELVVAGSGNLTVADLQFLRISTAVGYTGALNLTTVAASAASQAITGGNGNDVFNLTTTFTGAGDTINGGAGTDELRVADTAAVALTNVTNVETITVTGTTNTTVTTVAGNQPLGGTLSINGSGMTGAATLTTAVAGTETYYLNITGTANGDTLVASIQNDTIDGGAGNDTITGAAGADRINVGAGTDTVLIAGAGETAAVAAAAQATLTDGTAGFAATVDVVTGMAAGDLIDLQALTVAAFSGAVVTTNAATISDNTGDIGLVRGNYNTTTGIFTASATGTDSAVVYDVTGTTAGGNVEMIVLVGFAGGATTTTDGLITLA